MINIKSSGKQESPIFATTLSLSTNAPVGRGHVPAACRNYQVSTDLFMTAVCRFAVIRDMSPPYRGGLVYHGAFLRVVCKERSDVAIYEGSFIKAVARGIPDAPRAGTTNCVQIRLFVPSAAYAVGGDMSPPYRGVCKKGGL